MIDEREIKIKVTARELAALEEVALELREQRHNLRVGVGNAAAEIIGLVLKKYPRIVGELLGETTAEESDEPTSGANLTGPPGRTEYVDEKGVRRIKLGYREPREIRPAGTPRIVPSPVAKTGTEG